MGKGGRADFDGPLALPIAPHRFRRMGQKFGPEPFLVVQLLGKQHLRHLDLVVETDLKPYDYSALVPVIEGAGGVMTDWDGRALTLASEGRVVAAGDPALGAAARRLLAGG